MSTAREKKEEAARVKYLAANGTICPCCGAPAEQLTGMQIQVDVGTAWQEMNCCVCGKSWNDVYKLVDVDFFEGIEPEESK